MGRDQVQASGEDVNEAQRQHHQHNQVAQNHHQNMANAAFHISRPTLPISNMISPPPLHHTSIILDDNPYHVSRIMLQQHQHDNFQVYLPPFLFSAHTMSLYIRPIHGLIIITYSSIML